MRELDQYDEGFVETGFDAVAESYGEVPFLRHTAAALVELVRREPLQHVLDIATGPGTTALLLARAKPDCQVVGIDVAPAMIAVAASRARRLAISGARFEVASALSLPFPASSFDAVLCSSAIYYMADIEGALRAWQRVLRPQGLVAFTTFGAGVLEPMSSLFDARVRAHGISVPQPTPLHRLNSPASCRQLLTRAGLHEIIIHECQVGHWLADENAWWSTLMSTGFQALVAALNPAERLEFEREHKREVRAHVGSRGLWLDVPAIVACGKRSGS